MPHRVTHLPLNAQSVSAIVLAASLRTQTEALVRQAGDMAMTHFRPGARTSARVWSKAGGSPVTEADIAVDAFLKISLSQLLPRAAWLSEETADDQVRLHSEMIWIVDPIDGTRAFLEGHPDWAVSVALIAHGTPVLGLLYAPAHDSVYSAVLGSGAFHNGLRISASKRSDWNGARIAGPRHAMIKLAEHEPGIVVSERIPSLALRLARVADGSIDAGLVSTDARDWDIAAADLILTEAGGEVTTLSGDKPAYNGRKPRHGVLVVSGPGLKADLLTYARAIDATGGLERAARLT